MADDLIRSRTNGLVRRIRDLKKRADDMVLLEGSRLLEEALTAGVHVVEVAADPRFGEAGRESDLLDQLTRRGVVVRRLEERLLGSLSELETSPGVMALARRPAFPESALLRKVPLVVVVVGLQNPGNVGAVLRTAEAAGATGAYLTDHTADPLSWKALRGSMGSALRLPHLRLPTAAEALERTRKHGLRTIAATVGDGTPYDHADLRGPLAIVMGAEGTGLPADLQAGADVRVQIPMAGQVESLNVAVAAGVLLFEAARQRRLTPV